LKHRGAIFQIEASNKGLALVDVKSGTLKIYVLIDPDEEQILDAKFFTYGGELLTDAAEAFCEEIIGKNINEIQNMRAENLPPEIPSMIIEAYPEKKNIALAAIAAMGSARLRAHTAAGRAQADEEWNSLSEAEKMGKIEEALNNSVRTMLAGDGGGLEVIGIKDNKIVIIRYQGACAACGAASGGTLYYIENELQQRVYYDLTVEPDFTEVF
jgi:NifU-like protein